MRKLIAAVSGIVVVFALAAQVASASTIAYAKGGDIWLMNVNGSGQHRVTRGGIFSNPTQADGGTILAQVGGDVVRLDQYGHELSAPVGTAVTGGSTYSGWIDLKGPFDPVISPDGATFAYWGGGTVFEFDYGCQCSRYDRHSFVRYGGPRTFSEPSSQNIGQEDYAYPSYIDSHTLLMSGVGVVPLISEVAVYTLGTGGNHMTQWFSDNSPSQHTGSSDQWLPDSDGMSEGVMNRQQNMLAFVVGVQDQTSKQTSEELRLYAMNGPPAANANAPSFRCAFTNPAGGHFHYPSFSPDGRYLAWQEGDGIHVAAVGSLTNCTGFSNALVVRGGEHPSFGPAGLAPRPCIVPNVKGHTLTVARRMLTAGNCATGTVTTPRKPKHKPPHGKRWALLVTSESPAAGSREPHGTRVRLKLSYAAIKK